MDDSSLEEIALGPPKTAEEPTELSAWAKGALAFENSLEGQIQVAEVGKLHTLVARLRKDLRKAQPHERDARMWVIGENLDVKIGEESKERAFRILDAFVRAIEARNWKIEFVAKDAYSERFLTMVRAGEQRQETFTFTFRERMRESKEPIPKNRRFFGETHWTRLQPRGEFFMELGRKRFRDSKRGKLEQKLNAVMIEIIEQAEAARRDREAKRSEQARRQSEYEIATTKKHELEDEQERVNQLRRRVAGWIEAKEIREFVEHVRQDRKPEAGSDLHSYLAWAEIQAERFDPMCESPSSILDEADAIERVLRNAPGWGY